MKALISIIIAIVLSASLAVNYFFFTEIDNKNQIIEDLKSRKPNIAGFNVELGDLNVEDLTRPQYLENQIQKTLENYSGDYSVYIKDIYTNDVMQVNPNEYFYAASLYKVPLAIAVMQDIEAERYELDEEIIFEEKYRDSGSGVIQNSPTGTKYTIEQLIELLLKESDNVAQLMLTTKIQNNTPSSLLPNLNHISSRDLGIIFEDLYLNRYLNKDNSKKLVSLMKKTAFDDRISEGLPKSVDYSHKIGNWDEANSWHDCGLIIGRTKVLSVCILSKGTTFEEFKEASKMLGLILTDHFDL